MLTIASEHSRALAARRHVVARGRCLRRRRFGRVASPRREVCATVGGAYNPLYHMRAEVKAPDDTRDAEVGVGLISAYFSPNT